jgi:hypothetical protein
MNDLRSLSFRQGGSVALGVSKVDAAGSDTTFALRLASL